MKFKKLYNKFLILFVSSLLLITMVNVKANEEDPNISDGANFDISETDKIETNPSLEEDKTSEELSEEASDSEKEITHSNTALPLSPTNLSSDNEDSLSHDDEAISSDAGNDDAITSPLSTAVKPSEATLSASSDSNEANTLDAAKAIDGNPATRWASAANLNPHHLILSYDKLVSVKGLHIMWERDNATNYTIESSLDGVHYEVLKEFNTKPSLHDDYINFDSPKELKYLKINIKKFDATGMTREGVLVTWPTISIHEVKVSDEEIIAPESPLAPANQELRLVSTSADSIEDPKFTADKATDKDSNNTRWASQAAKRAHWLKLDYNKAHKIRAFKITWERTNPLRYRIEGSNNNTNWTTLKSFNTTPSEHVQYINLDKDQYYKYIRLYVEDFLTKAPNKDGQIVDWPTISVYEFEVFDRELVIPRTKDLNKIARELVVNNEIDADTNTLILPTVPEDFGIEFLGADYEEIIHDDLSITHPLNDKVVKVNFRVKYNDDYADSPDFSITVKSAKTNRGNNPKPKVIPALQEWLAGDGNIDFNNITNLTYKDDSSKLFIDEFKELLKHLDINLNVSKSDVPLANGLHFELSDKAYLRKEGYEIELSSDKIVVSANKHNGLYFATKTIYQMLKQDKNLPIGTIRDYPKYDIRGFMLDVGRRPFSKKMLNDFIETMAYYKLNDLQLHLNDNLIFLQAYPKGEAWKAYSAFRLESNIKKGGLNQIDLTSTDMYYTKAEFKQLILDARYKGIAIVPEFDTPAHALQFTKVRPDLRFGDGNREIDHFNLHEKYDESLAFVKEVWNEYILGDDPVFDKETILNIGTDEYDGRYPEEFRKFTDDLLAHAMDNGHTARLWGSLSMRKGKTNVRSNKVQMNIWNDGWANPKAMYKEGFDLIDMNDARLYIVPKAGYYWDYLDNNWLYSSYDPAIRMKVPSGSKQVLGGAYAIWNDMIDKNANGLSEIDIFDRYYSALPYYASALYGQKDLSFSDAKKLVADISIDYVNPYDLLNDQNGNLFELALNDLSTANNGINFKNNNSQIKENEIILKNSYIESDVNSIGGNYTFKLKLKVNEMPSPGKILMEADSEYGKHRILILKDGSLGFEREGYEYSFNYFLPVDKEVILNITSTRLKTTLVVDDRHYDAIGRYEFEDLERAKNLEFSTFSLPIKRIGAKENGLDYSIFEMSANTSLLRKDYNPITIDKTKASSDNEDPSEPLVNAFDKNPNTIWHSKWSGGKKDLPATIEINLAKKMDINGFYYLPRQSGSNGHISKLKLYYANENNDYEPIDENISFKQNAKEKVFYFNPVKTDKLKLVITEGKGGFASAAELSFLEGTTDLRNNPYIVSYLIQGEGKVNLDKNLIRRNEIANFSVSENVENFEGYYDIFGNLLSEDPNYQLTVKDKNIAVLAKFKEAESKIIDLIDPTTKINVSYDQKEIKDDLQLIVSKIENKIDSVDYDNYHVQGYDISFRSTKTNTIIKPSNKVLVKIPIMIEGDNLKLMHIKDNIHNEVPYVIDDNHVVFASDDFSVYYLRVDKEKEYTIKYEYKQDPKDTIKLDLPSELIKHLTQDNNTYSLNTKIKPKEIEIKSFNDNINDGIWTFSGYNKTELSISENEEDNNFIAYFIFKPNTYDLILDYNYEKANPKEKLISGFVKNTKLGTKLEDPNERNKEGNLEYVFKEWNLAKDGRGEKVTKDSVITKNTRVYAIWNLKQIPLSPAKPIPLKPDNNKNKPDNNKEVIVSPKPIISPAPITTTKAIYLPDTGINDEANTFALLSLALALVFINKKKR